MSRNFCLTLLLASTICASSAVAFEPSEKDFSFGNRLVDAVNTNNSDIVKALLANGENPDSTGKFDTSPLHRAVFNDNIEILNLLLSYNADINIKDYGGATPLHIAAREGEVDAATALLAKGADINSTDEQGYTPLHRAVNYNKTDVSLYLISQGADINTANKEGNTPLIDAIRVSNPILVKELIVKGADKKAKNNKGLDAFDYAIKMSNPMVDSILAKSLQELKQDSPETASSNSADVPAFVKNEQAAPSTPDNAMPEEVTFTPVDNTGVKSDNVESPSYSSGPLSLTPAAKAISQQANMKAPSDSKAAAVIPSEDNAKAPRLPSDGSIPPELLRKEKPEPVREFSKASEKKPAQMTQITTIQQMPVDNSYAETGTNNIINLNKIPENSSATQYVTKPVEDLTKQPVSENADWKTPVAADEEIVKPAEPASITYNKMTGRNMETAPENQPEKTLEGKTSKIPSTSATAPVDSLQVTAATDNKTSGNTAEPNKQIDWEYATEVDSIFNNLNDSSLKESKKLDKKAPAKKAENTDYSRFTNNLSENINEFYNNDKTAENKKDDISPAQKIDAETDKAAAEINMPKSKPLSLSALNTLPTQETAPEAVKDYSNIDVKMINAPENKKDANEQIASIQKVESETMPSLPDVKENSIAAAVALNSLNLKDSSADNDLNGPHSLIQNFNDANEAISFYNENSSKSGIVYNYKIVKSDNKYALAVGKLDSAEDAKGLCEGFATAEHPCKPISSKDAGSYKIEDVKKVYALIGSFKDKDEANKYFNVKSKEFLDTIDNKVIKENGENLLQLGPVANGMDAKKLCDSFTENNKNCNITVQ